jgi:hypothetical protein
MSLEDIADLVASRPAGECRSLQARLRAYLAGRISQVRQQAAEMGMFERQLQTVLDRLPARDPGPEHCGRGCICEADLDLAPDQTPARPAPWGCSLHSDALATRTAQWRALAAAATSVERGSGTARLMLPADPEMITAVAALCAAETACCPHAPVPARGHRRAGDPGRGSSQHHGPARHAFPGQHAQPAMSTTAVFLTALTAAGLVLLLWVIGRAVTAAGNRIAPGQGRSRHYLAGRLDGVQITAIIDYGDELLVSLATRDAQLAAVFRIAASTCSLTRVRRWHDESTPLRAYRSYDGAVMLADPALGGNAPCEPPIPDAYHARDEATHHDHSPTEDK